MKPMDFRFKLGESEWTLDFHSITVDESIELCKLTGCKWIQLCGDFDQGDALAVKAFFWLARRKAGEQLTFDGEAMNFRWADFGRELLRPVAEDTTEDPGQAPDPTAATPKTSRKK